MATVGVREPWPGRSLWRSPSQGEAGRVALGLGACRPSPRAGAGSGSGHRRAKRGAGRCRDTRTPHPAIGKPLARLASGLPRAVRFRSWRRPAPAMSVWSRSGDELVGSAFVITGAIGQRAQSSARSLLRVRACARVARIVHVAMSVCGKLVENCVDSRCIIRRGPSYPQFIHRESTGSSPVFHIERHALSVNIARGY